MLNWYKCTLAYKCINLTTFACAKTSRLCIILSVQIQECILAIMDATVDKSGTLIHHEVLEVDDEGHTPTNKKYESPDDSSIEIIINNDLKV